MNRLSLNISLAALGCLFSFINASSQTTGNIKDIKGNVLIALLAETPQETIENCSGSDLMNLLTEDGKIWIESIDCANVNLKRNEAGVEMNMNQENNYTSFVQFNFKPYPEQLLATNVSFYGYDSDGENNGSKPQIFINRSENPSSMNGNQYFTNKNKVNTLKANDIYLALKNKSDTKYEPSRIYTTAFQDGDNKILSCKISVTNTKKISKSVILYALQVFYNGIYEVNKEEIETSLNELQEDPKREVRHYDLYGKVLSKVPEKGIYLRREGTKTTKHIAY